jgi:hypothetical protein
MTRVFLVAFALSVTPAFAQTPTLSCDTSGVYRHCWDRHGNTVVPEDRLGDYVHGWESQGRAWTTWEHDGRTVT